MKFIFITDPLVTTEGAVRPALLLAKQFRLWGHKAEIISTKIAKQIIETLEFAGIKHRQVGSRLSIIRSIPTFEAWAKSLAKPIQITKQEESDVIVNTSSCIMASSRVYYAQGTMTNALDDISPRLPLRYRCFYKLLAPSLKLLERRLFEKFRGASELFVANSAFCSSIYKKWGINVDYIMHPPLDCELFKPSTIKPSEDYVLTHVGAYGKEGKLSLIRTVADSGVLIKVFGREPASWHRKENKNIVFLGKVSDRRLVDLYSNALFTMFAFNHEPFGYIPIESMSCGTPVLTFNFQGPAETITDSQTGWLVRNDEELVKKAISIWKKGVGRSVRAVCRNNALAYDVKKSGKKWIEMLQTTT